MKAGLWMVPSASEQQSVREASAGQVVQIAGKRYKITRKTTSAAAIVRWFWWNDLGERVGKIWARLIK